MYYKDHEHLYLFLKTLFLHGDSSEFGAEETNLILYTIITGQVTSKLETFYVK